MVTQLQIQSIVDGECSHEARAVILLEMGSDPVQWRTLALALLEEQEWARQISSFSRSCPTDSSEGKATTIVAQEKDRLDAEQMVRIASSSHSGFANAESGKGKSPWLSALAASFLVGIGIYGGSFLPGWSSMRSNDVTPAVAEIPNRNPLIEAGDFPTDGALDSEMRMLVSGPNKEREEIPIYDLNAIDHDVFVKREMYELAKINQRLRKEGFELDVRPEYYTGKLNDGRQLIVPVKHVGLKPYGL